MYKALQNIETYHMQILYKRFNITLLHDTSNLIQTQSFHMRIKLHRWYFLNAHNRSSGLQKSPRPQPQRSAMRNRTQQTRIYSADAWTTKCRIVINIRHNILTKRLLCTWHFNIQKLYYLSRKSLQNIANL